VIANYAKEFGLKATSKEFGISSQAVRILCTKLNIDWLNRSGSTKETLYPIIADLLLTDKTQTEIAEFYNVTVARVCQINQNLNTVGLSRFNGNFTTTS